jgi:hypothetical protein
VRERVTSPGGRDSDPSIALDDAGSVWIAFTRWAPEDPDACANVSDCFLPADGVYLISNQSGEWSEPERMAPPASNSPSLEIRDGAVHLGYVAGTLCGEICGPAMVRYRTNASGSWSETGLGPTFGRLELELGSDGSAFLAYWNLPADDDGLTVHPTILFSHVDRSSGVVTNETVWQGEASAYIENTLMALDSTDVAHLVSYVSFEAGQTSLYMTRQLQGWTEQPTLPIAAVASIAVDGAGSIHGLACCANYLTNRAGDYETVELLLDTDGYYTRGDIAIDPFRRAHVLFTTYEDGPTLWYAAGPA